MNQLLCFLALFAGVFPISASASLQAQWEKTESGFVPAGVACHDSQSNTYITGYREMPLPNAGGFRGKDFSILKLNSAGSIEWETIIAKSQSGNSDQGLAIACIGNRVVVTGTYVEGPNAPSIGPTLAYRTHTFVSLFDEAGNELTSTTFHPEQSLFPSLDSYPIHTTPKKILVDDSGIYFLGMTGTYTGPSNSIQGQQQWVIAKFNFQLQKVWQNLQTGSIYAPPSMGSNSGTDLILQNDSVYAVGHVNNLGTGEDLRIVRLSRVNGNLLNSKDLDQVAGHVLYRSSFIRATESGLVVSGISLTPSRAPILLQLKPDTTFVQATEIPLPQKNSNSAVQITGTVVKNDTVLISGHYITQSEGNNIFLTKLDSMNQQVWLRTYNGPTVQNDFSGALTVDDASFIWISGGMGILNSDADFVALKISPNGDLLDHYTSAGLLNRSDSGNYISILKNGSVFVLGNQFDTDPFSADLHAAVLTDSLTAISEDLHPTKDWKWASANQGNSFQWICVDCATEQSSARIYSLTGQRIRQLSAQENRIEWDGTDDAGSTVSKGHYILRISNQNFRMILTN